MVRAMQLQGLKWDRDGLVSVVVQDAISGEVRMVGYANQEALRMTLDTGFAHFFSRSRQQLWLKGETSGHRLRVREVWTDCDGDAVIYLAEAEGPTCHTLRETCFFKRVTRDGELVDDPKRHAQSTLPQLWQELVERRDSTAAKSYTRSLLDAGVQKIRAKVEEEALELSRALQSEQDSRVISEAGDVLYHVLVGLLARNVSLRDLEGELAKRSGTSGLVEKASRTPGR